MMSEGEYVLGLYLRTMNVCLILVAFAFVLMFSRFVVDVFFPSFVSSVGFAFSLCQVISACMGIGFLIIAYRIRKDYLEKVVKQ